MKLRLRYSTLTKQDIKSVIRKYFNNVGVKMNLATCIKEEETNFEEWLNEERKEKTDRKYSQRYERLLLEQKDFQNLLY